MGKNEKLEYMELLLENINDDEVENEKYSNYAFSTLIIQNNIGINYIKKCKNYEEYSKDFNANCGTNELMLMKPQFECLKKVIEKYDRNNHRS